MVRVGSALLCLMLGGVACASEDTADTYVDSIRSITLAMRNESLAAIPDGVTITRSGVDDVVSARRSAIAALEAISPPPDFTPEHEALIRTLTELSTAAERLMEETAGLDEEAFRQAVLSAADLDAIAVRVGGACDALERRASDLGVAVDLAC